MNKLIKIISILIFTALIAKTTSAQDFHGKFLDWNLFSLQQGKNKICYIVSIPMKRQGNYDKRGEPYFVVTNNGSDLDEFHISAGYNYKNNSEVELSFGLKKFSIFTYENLAWGNDKTDDIEIIKAMRLGDDVIVSAISNSNFYSQDTYSLIGFFDAYKEMRKICPRIDPGLEIKK